MNSVKIEINQLENIDWILEAATDLSHATEADLQAMKRRLKGGAYERILTVAFWNSCAIIGKSKV